MTVLSSDDGAVIVEDRDDADVYAGAAPIPGDPRKMGEVIHAVLSDRSKTVQR